jgi:hypothetical protein
MAQAGYRSISNRYSVYCDGSIRQLPGFGPPARPRAGAGGTTTHGNGRLVELEGKL